MGFAVVIGAAIVWAEAERHNKVSEEADLGGPEDDDSGLAKELLYAATNLLSSQLELVRSSNGGLPARATDDFAMGYVVGFLDTFFSHSGVGDPIETYGAASALVFSLFETSSREELGLFDKFLDRQDWEETKRGTMFGSADCLQWLSASEFVPRGLYEHCVSDSA